MLVKTALMTLLVFSVSAVWLYVVWSAGNETNNWTRVTAVVLENEIDETLSGRPRGWATTIGYTFDGIDYVAVIDDYLVGGGNDVYVDPADPTRVVGVKGASLKTMGRPLIVVVGSGLFAVVLMLIALSPKEE